jgi:hypothetical protein
MECVSHILTQTVVKCCVLAIQIFSDIEMFLLCNQYSVADKVLR